jgi:outer membrane protein TolC
MNSKNKLRHNLTRIGLLLSIVISVLFQPHSYAVQSINFMDAWKRVLQSNDALAAKAQGVRRAEHLQDATNDLQLPEVTLGANYTRLDEDIRIKPSDLIASMPVDDINQALGITAPVLDGLFTSTLTDRNILSSSIRALWPIFTGWRIEGANNIAKAQIDEANYILMMEQQAKFEDLAKYYFSVVLAKQVLQTRVQVESGLKAHFNTATKLQQQGQINSLQTLQAQVAYDKSKVERNKSLRDLEIAQTALNHLLKLSGDVSPITTLFINDDLPAVNKYKDKTLQGYPGLKMLSAKKNQAKGLIKVEKGKYYPDVYLYGNYNLYEEDTLAAQIAPDWEVGVGISIPLLDTSGRSGKTKAAHSAVLQVDYLIAQAKRDLSVLVEKTYQEANQAIEEHQGLASSLLLANKNYALQNKAFKQGISTSLDVVDAQLFIASIKTQRLVASYNYVISLCKLLALSSEITSFKDYKSNKETRDK